VNKLGILVFVSFLGAFAPNSRFMSTPRKKWSNIAMGWFELFCWVVVPLFDNYKQSLPGAN
jgi:hypothetical protein